MDENIKGLIKSITEIGPTIYGVKKEAHHNMTGYGFLTVATEADVHGLKNKGLSKHLMLGVDKLLPSGGIEEHYHECDAKMPVFDHVYYVISGRIRATIGDVEKIVGADTLIYCPSNVKHSIINVGKGIAKVLRISGSGEGEKMGRAVYSKIDEV